MSVVVFENKD